MTEPIFEENIVSIRGNIAIDNPSIHCYRLLERQNSISEWVPIFTTDSMENIKIHLANKTNKLQDVWKTRFDWLLDNIVNIKDLSKDDILKMVYSATN